MAALSTSDGSVLVVKSLCDIILPLLGNTTSLKCLVEEGKSVFTNCAAHVLQNLDVMHPVGYLINTAVQAHHTVYGCGTKTLLVMVGLWIKEAELLLDKGIPLMAFIKGLQEATDILCKQVKDISCTVQIEQELVQSRHEILKCREDLIVDEENDFLEIEFSYEDNDLHEVRGNKSNDHRNTENETGEFENLCSGYHQKFLSAGDGSSTKLHEKCVDEMKENVISGDGLDDEIGWYFDDGKVPDAPSIDKAVCEKMDSVFSDFHNMAFPLKASKENEETHKLGFAANGDIGNQSRKNGESVALSSLSFTELNGSLNKSLHFSSMQMEGSDSSDEFDACFVDVDVKKSLDRAAALVDHRLLKNSKEAESSEDEFDACFEDVEHFDSSKQVIGNAAKMGTERNQNAMQTESLSKSAAFHNESPEIFCDDMKTLEEKLAHIFEAKSQSKVFKTVHQSRHFKSCNEGTLTEQLSFEDKEMDESIEDGEKISQISLEKKLAHIMAKKTVSSRSHIMNTSRHFKTIESTVRSLNGELETESNKTMEERIKEEEFESKLQEILAKKGSANVDKSRVLNSSKHFKTFESSAAVENDPLKRSNFNLQIDDTCVKESEIPVPAKDLAGHMSMTRNSSGNCNHKKKENNNLGNEMENSSIKTNLQLNTQSGDCVTKDSFKSHTVTCLKSLCHGLSHGANEEMQFVFDILQNRRMMCTKETCSDVIMHTSQVHTICMPNTDASRSCVLEGLLAELTTDQMMMLSSCERVQRNCLLINGDLKPNFKHIGFKQSVKTKVISKSLETKTKKQKWMEECMETIHELHVAAIFVKGIVDPDFLDQCTTQNIVICTNTPCKILQAVGESTKACIAVYLTECTMENVASGITFEPWTRDWSDTFNPTSNYAAIKLQGICLHTVIFCHPSDNVVRLKEERFLHCLNRVLNSLKSKIVLPGRGATEEHCYNHLMKLAEEKLEDSHSWVTQDNENNRSAVFQSIAQGFLNYANLLPLETNTTGPNPLPTISNGLQLNLRDSISTKDYLKSASETTYLKNFEIETGDDEFDNACYDDYLSKVEAWKSSAHIVMQVLLADMQIITGITDESRNDIKKGGNFVGII